jgi:hypothetical protein
MDVRVKVDSGETQQPLYALMTSSRLQRRIRDNSSIVGHYHGGGDASKDSRNLTAPFPAKE